MISHDRWFLDRIATHVLAFEGDSQVTWFEGNFDAYEEHRRAKLGAEADRPHRITYKKLVRLAPLTPGLGGPDSAQGRLLRPETGSRLIRHGLFVSGLRLRP